MRLVLLSVVLVLMVVLEALHAGLPVDVGARAALVFGFLLLAGFILGEMTARIAVPRITGYLLAGMLCGPSLLGLVDRPVIEHLRLVDDLALTLIALTAGGELRASRLRARARSIASITVVQTVVVFALTGAALWLLRPLVDLGPELDATRYLVVVAVLALIATATSPSTAVAVIVEARARGPITDTVLGTTVLKDIVVLVGFSLVMSLGMSAFEVSSGARVSSVGWALLEILLSLGTGAVFGGLMILYLRFIQRQKVLFVLAASFLIISVSENFHLDKLLVAVVAGFCVSNFSLQGERFQEGLERAAAPTFLVFFCLAGAGLDLSVLASIWWVALIYVALRAAGTWGGTLLGTRLARDPAPVRRLAWTGFIGQAGVSLGLAIVVHKTFPDVGPIVSNLVVGAIVLNQLAGPVAFRLALNRANETRDEPRGKGQGR